MKYTHKRGKGVSAATHSIVADYAQQCWQEIIKPEHGIEVRFRRHMIDIKTKIGNGGSWGGRNMINIDVVDYERGSPYCWEYRAYQKSPLIGYFNAPPEICLFALVAHEMAHYVQRRFAPTTEKYYLTHRKPHGDCFKDIYRILRVALINPHAVNIGCAVIDWNPEIQEPAVIKQAAFYPEIIPVSTTSPTGVLTQRALF